LLVPVAAIRTINNHKMVIVMRNGVPTPVPVTLGASSDTFSAWLSGDLQEGDLLVITLDTTSTSGFGFMGGGVLDGGGIRDRTGQQPPQGNAQPPSGN
jgi:hypothetical protein